MAGGGGGYFRNPGEIKDAVEAAEKETRSESFEIIAKQILDAYLANFNDRNHRAISVHLAEIKTALGKELEGSIDLMFGGSVAKHTYVNGISDVDALLLIESCELADRAPAEALDYVAGRLRERFPVRDVEKGRMAVTVKFEDAEIQVVPAIRCGSAVKIASAGGETWAQVRPRAFSRALQAVNSDRASKVVPVIKLAKAIINNLPSSHQISGYHVESLAVKLFAEYKGDLRTKDMLQHFFEAAPEAVRTPIRDPTGQSIFVDEYLGGVRSMRREMVADALARVSRRMKLADSAESVEQWKSLFGDI